MGSISFNYSHDVFQDAHIGEAEFNKNWNKTCTALKAFGLVQKDIDDVLKEMKKPWEDLLPIMKEILKQEEENILSAITKVSIDLRSEHKEILQAVKDNKTELQELKQLVKSQKKSGTERRPSLMDNLQIAQLLSFPQALSKLVLSTRQQQNATSQELIRGVQFTGQSNEPLPDRQLRRRRDSSSAREISSQEIIRDVEIDRENNRPLPDQQSRRRHNRALIRQERVDVANGSLWAMFIAFYYFCISSLRMLWPELRSLPEYLRQHYSNAPWYDNNDTLLVKMRIKRKRQGGEEIFPVDEMFTKDGKTYDKRVLVEGGPGSGKTTMCQRLVQEWCDNELPKYFPQIKFVFHLKGRDIRSASVLDTIKANLHLDTSANWRERKAWMDEIISMQEHVLIILDAYDEIFPPEIYGIDSEWDDLVSGKLLPKCYLVVTSREHQDLVRVRRHLDNVVELVPPELHDFIYRFFPGDRVFADELVNLVTSLPTLRNYIGSSILPMVSFFHFCKTRRSILKLPINLFNFYHEFLSGGKRDGFHEALGEIAFNARRNDLVFDESKLGPALRTRAESSKFLNKLSSSCDTERHAQYKFSHISILWYFVASHFIECVSKRNYAKLGNTIDARVFRILDEFDVLSEMRLSADDTIVAAQNLISRTSGDFSFIFALVDCLRSEFDVKRVANELRVCLPSHLTIDLSKERTLLGFYSTIFTPIPLDNSQEQILNINQASIVGLPTQNNLWRAFDLFTKLKTTITVLQFERCKPVDMGYVLRAFISSDCLEQLYVYGTSDKSVESLLRCIIQLKSLHRLHLDSVKLPDVKTTLAKGILGNLSSLEIPNCGVGPNGCLHLARVIESNRTLTDLDISSNGIGRQGALSITRMLEKNKQLKHLCLASNDIREEDCTQIASALVSVNKTLEKLDISNNSIGDQGAYSLAYDVIAHSQNLHSLKVSNCGLSQYGMQCLLTAMSDSVILLSMEAVGHLVNVEDIVRLLRRRRDLQLLMLSVDEDSRSRVMSVDASGGYLMSVEGNVLTVRSGV
ncbi:uncharacterized protein LOC116604129 isoform X2 [Nematostella vectensis]|uniref:uncharacterized protein LOC116604129 isoform X2 n=1 Tax=Nematostella vectensis TaxID=45351 RepID=UPI0020773D3B|nr:uncharacterized protein LOC116604129 isoform X2 [Nematostella vectensis]